MNNHTGAIVNLAWPETKIFKTSSLYDGAMKVIGLCKDDYYKVGHAALLLIDYRTSDVLYFDFGRYSTPQGYGRVRDMESDPEMTIKTKAIVESGEVTNLTEILIELQKNKSTHADGRLVASVTNNIDFDSSYTYSKSLQDEGAVLYGPFQYFGSNCCRFVAETYKNGVHSFFKKNRINLSYVYFHTPISNVLSTYTGDNLYVINTEFQRVEEGVYSIFANKYESKKINEAKDKSNFEMPDGIQCLKGIGCNTWFLIEKTDKRHIFKVKRWSEEGQLEIDAEYSLLKLGFDINNPYQITYISNGISIKVIQNEKIYELQNINIGKRDKSSILFKRPRRMQLRKVYNKGR